MSWRTRWRVYEYVRNSIWIVPASASPSAPKRADPCSGPSPAAAVLHDLGRDGSRSSNSPDASTGNLGFRVARDLG
jgi:hypothetical protein